MALHQTSGNPILTGSCSFTVVALVALCTTWRRAIGLRQFLPTTLTFLIGVVSAQEPLAPAQIKQAMALGRSCSDIPIVRVGAKRGDFEVFIEGPSARVALHAAAARQMHQPFDTSSVTRDIAAPDYRIWLQYVLHGRRKVSVRRVVLQPKGDARPSAVILPVRERPFQLTVGHLPAHGIVNEVRWRNFEWVFDRLPVDDFQVILATTAGEQRYTVTAADRVRLMRVCT
jgi:hypothetical protein